MPVYLLDDSLVFPHPMLAEPNGLLAVGGDLSVPRLLLAYRNGIFPWYSEDNPILWFSPDPRLVLSLPDLYVSKKLNKIRSGRYEVLFGASFGGVIRSCSEVTAGQSRPDHEGHDRRLYRAHDRSYAHSVERIRRV
jgi:leucyl/phenylalanyl-tRNA--protein transferase